MKFKPRVGPQQNLRELLSSDEEYLYILDKEVTTSGSVFYRFSIFNRQDTKELILQRKGLNPIKLIFNTMTELYEQTNKTIHGNN